MGLLVAFFLGSIFFSFLCSILEAVLLSITPAYVGIKEQEGSAIAKDLARFKEDIDRPLAAILTLNTIAHTATTNVPPDLRKTHISLEMYV